MRDNKAQSRKREAALRGCKRESSFGKRPRSVARLEDMGGKVKDLRNSLWRETWVIVGDLVRGHTLGQAFEHKAYAKARAANARLTTKRVGILYDPTHVRIVPRVGSP